VGLRKCGLHAFRRYRTTWLRKNRVPEDLIRYWIGHADRTVTDGYSKVKEDREFRREVCAQVGLGFALPATEVRAESPVVVPSVPKNAVVECPVSGSVGTSSL
jgi:hypothetical protein